MPGAPLKSSRIYEVYLVRFFRAGMVLGIIAMVPLCPPPPTPCSGQDIKDSPQLLAGKHRAGQTGLGELLALYTMKHHSLRNPRKDGLADSAAACQGPLSVLRSSGRVHVGQNGSSRLHGGPLPHVGSCSSTPLSTMVISTCTF